jgi:hypothetical protein
MLLYKIHNPATGQRYEFRAYDLAAASLQIESNRDSYGEAPEIIVADITAEVERAEHERAIAEALDDLARSWGFDSMADAATYEASTVPAWVAEAAVLIAHRDACWQAWESGTYNYPPNPTRP